MKWRKAPPELVSFLDDAASNVEGSQKRMMFGFPAYFVNGNMFMAAHQEDLILRLAQVDREASLASGDGFTRFEPMAGRTMKEYVVVPKTVYDDRTRFDTLLQKCTEYVRGLPTKQDTRGRRRSKEEDRREHE